MNCVELLVKQAQDKPKKLALWLPDGNQVNFKQLLDLSASAQSLLYKYKIVPGESVLLLDNLGPRLYASIIAILASGATVILVEPWMPINKINHVIKISQPKVFLSNWIGKLWGGRVGSIRKIPHWVSVGNIGFESNQSLRLESIDPHLKGIITFTSGTTGQPKGVIRSQGYLTSQHRVFADSVGLEKHQNPDLCIFANFALANLASGRGSLIIPSRWKEKHLKLLDFLEENFQPDSLTCGPAFLMKLQKHTKLSSLKSIHVGGALADRSIYQSAMAHWPQAHFEHIYGSSEVEPVALADLSVALKRSEEKGFFQTLYLGNPVLAIKHRLEENTAWVSGDHVCPAYLGNEEETKKHKSLDDNGVLWHSMGDRIQSDDYGWWYMGRSSQSLSHFLLEQRIYSKLETSAGFIEISESGENILYIQNAKQRASVVKHHFPEVSKIYDTKIVRDLRHRSRIDRGRSAKRGVR